MAPKKRSIKTVLNNGRARNVEQDIADIKERGTAAFYAALSLVFLSIAIFVGWWIFERATQLGPRFLLAYYGAVVMLGISAAIVLFGSMRSYAALTGHHGPIKGEVGGAAALLILVVVGAFTLVKPDETYDVGAPTPAATTDPLESIPKGQSLPMKVTFHYAQVGNQCYTINSQAKSAADCKPGGSSSIAGSFRGQTQEVTIDWDRNAMRSLGIPFNLTDEQISFEYDCYYTNPPGTYAAKRGEKCGEEKTGEPLLKSFSMRLTGSLRNRFKLSYSCVGEQSFGPVSEGIQCKVDGVRGIGELGVDLVAVSPN